MSAKSEDEDDNLLNISDNDNSDAEVVRICEKQLGNMMNWQDLPSELTENQGSVSKPEKRMRENSEESDQGFTLVTKRKPKRRVISQSDDSIETRQEDPKVEHEVCVTSLEPLPKQIAFAKILRAEKIENIMRIRYKSSYKVLISFKDPLEAEKLIKCEKLKEMGYLCQKTFEDNMSYGIVKGFDIDVEEKEILDNLKTSCEVLSVKRLKRLDFEGKWVDSETIRLCFKSPVRPTYVYGYGCRFKVETYVFPVTQCAGCWRFGHVIKFCPSKKILCPKCGGRHSNCEITEFKCINCKGSHMSLDKSCPIFHKEKNIRQIMSTENITYRRALQIYIQKVKERNNYPPAPTIDSQDKNKFLNMERFERPSLHVVTTKAMIHQEEYDSSSSINSKKSSTQTSKDRNKQNKRSLEKKTQEQKGERPLYSEVASHKSQEKQARPAEDEELNKEVNEKKRFELKKLLSKLKEILLEAGLPLSVSTSWSSSERSPAPPPAPAPLVDAAELVRDAPLYPPLQDTEEPDILDTIETEPSYNDLETSIEESRILVTPQDLSSAHTIQTDDETNVQSGVAPSSDSEERIKRSSGQEWDKTAKPADRRVKTGDTILNIRGAVRDAIGDAGAAPGPRASSRLDTFVIRPAHARRPHLQDQPAPANNAQAPRSERELLVEAHARAVIACDLVNVTSLRWYKDNEPMSLSSSPSSAEGVWREGGSAVVGRATRADAGAWRCAGVDKAGKTVSGKPTQLLIYEPVRSVYLAVDGRRLDAGNTWVPVRDKTVLEVRCVAEGGVPPPELSWRLLALEPSLDHRPYLRIHNTNYSIEGVSLSHAVVTAARELHNATLQCHARQRTPPAAPAPAPTPDAHTAKLEIHVTYPPSFVISRWPGFGVSLSAGSAAALRCDVDANPPARAWWLRDDADPTSSPPPVEAGDESARGSATLRWPTLRASHAGWYRCRATWLDAEYSSIGYYLNVIAPEDNAEPVTEPQDEDEEADHQKVEVPVGGNVQLHCPKGSVGCWWRRVVGNASETWAPAGSHHAHGVLGIKDALYQEGGEYRCVGARAPDLKRLRELKRVTLKVTGGATATALSAVPAAGGWRLECGACGKNVRVLWVRSGVTTRATHATLNPDLAQHCWRAVLHVIEPDEVWCVAATSDGGAVAVFPRRAPMANPNDPSPEPARRALHAGSSTPFSNILSALIPLLGIFLCR